MPLVFERVYTPGIAQLSYLIGDDKTGDAAVIDPRPNVSVYDQLARQYSLAIKYIFETHIHADFMSGARELAALVGTARLLASVEGNAKYGFPIEPLKDGDQFELGPVILTAKHTPGHTPEHIAFVVAEKNKQDAPWGVFTGDSLFAESAGRPDLLGNEQTESLIEELFHTLRDFYLQLDDGVMIFPGHGAGSACGADIGDRPVSTIGYERRFNPFLQHEDLDPFQKFVKDGVPPEPHHYKRLKKLNAAGPPVLGRRPTVPPLPPEAFKRAVEQGNAQLVDARQMLAFGGGHIAGAISIGPRPELAVWAGQMLDVDKPILLVVEDEANLDWIVWNFVYTGFTTFEGYLVGGMKAWDNAGFALQKLPQVTVHELQRHRDDWQVLDVRAPDEWKSGHIPGARHKYVGELRDEVDGVAALDRHKPVAVYCDSGYRANLAASIMQSRGFEDVRNVPGSWQAWKKAGYDVEK